jgi:hypothetical protein
MRSLSAGVALACLLAHPAFAQGVSKSSDQFSRLRLVASGVARDVLPFEPVPVRLTASNPTSQPIRGNLVLDFSARRVAASVRQPNGKVVEVKQLSAANVLFYIVPGTIRPGQRSTRLETLEYDLDTLFPAAGDYRVSFRLMSSDRATAVASKALKVRVRSPKGADVAAYEHIRLSPIRGSFFPLADADQLEEVVTMFPQSRYAARALMTLAQRALALQDSARAIELLTAASKSGSPLSREATERLGDPDLRARRR